MCKITAFCDVLMNRWQVSFLYSSCHFMGAVENVCDGACAKNVPLFFEDVSDAIPAPSHSVELHLLSSIRIDEDQGK